MIFDTIIARHSDGLFLAETYDETNQDVPRAKRKVKQLLKVSLPYEEATFKSVGVEGYLLHYKIYDGVIYLAICHQNYPNKLANSYLDELHNLFIQEVKNHFGPAADIRSKIETIEEAYYFLKFDRQMKKLKTDFQDVKSTANIERIRNDLTDIHNSLVENIDLLINRTGKLEDTLGKTSKLKEDSKKWKDKTKKLEWDLWLKKNMTYIVIASLILLFILIKFIL